MKYSNNKAMLDAALDLYSSGITDVTEIRQKLQTKYPGLEIPPRARIANLLSRKGLSKKRFTVNSLNADIAQMRDKIHIRQLQAVRDALNQELKEGCKSVDDLARAIIASAFVHLEELYHQYEEDHSLVTLQACLRHAANIGTLVLKARIIEDKPTERIDNQLDLKKDFLKRLDANSNRINNFLES